MKQIHNILSGIFASALIFVGCTKDYDAPLPNDKDLPEATYTISQLKKTFLGNPDYLISDNADNDKYKGVFSVYNMNPSQEVTINGIVISTDAGGNTYKKLVIRDPKDGSCIDLSVDVSGISAYYPVGQAVQVTCNTVQIGLYADMPVIGTTYYNNASNRLRYEPGRMPWPVGQSIIKAYGMPDVAKAQPIVKTIPEIIKGAPDIYSQLVEIDYVEFGYFVNGSSVSLFPTNTFISMNDPKADPNITFSEENDLNVPVSRGIRDNKGNIIPVTTSSYAKFASQKLPKGAFNLKAIVAWYKDQAAKDGNFQMSVQQFSDIVKVSDTFEGSTGGETTGQGTKEDPYTVDDAIISQGKTAVWIEGYIIGSVNTTANPFENQYAAPFVTNSNLILAGSATEKDESKMLMVQLPTGAIRDALNLVNNDSNLGKQVKLQGNLETYFSKPGIKSVTDYVLGGVQPPVEQTIFEETFAANQGAFTTKAVAGDQVWGHTIYNGNGYMKISGYANNKANANEDWLISPAIDLTGVSSATISFDQAINKGVVANMAENHTLWFTLDDGTTWTKVPVTTYPAGNNWSFVNSGKIAIPAEFLNKKNVKFGFKYISTDQEASTWEINNVVIK